mgnify:FL=1
MYHAILEQFLVLQSNESRERKRREHDNETLADILIEHFFEFVAAFKEERDVKGRKQRRRG